ncbi:MAG TPA: hypothetical protein VFF02_05545 [Anaeromyxobacteraceae bacterium]|nr:hypothetical protein [Anaeromyxobacteraceae bacterium]
MTPRTEITFATPRRHGWKDTLVVAFLLIVLGAFVAQLVKPAPSTSRAPDTTAASQACLDARC